jgi:hypothetical protein
MLHLCEKSVLGGKSLGHPDGEEGILIGLSVVRRSPTPFFPVMPYEVQWEDHRLIAHFSGEVYLHDVLGAQNSWISDPRFDDIAGMLIDLREADGRAFSEQDLRVTGAVSRAVSPVVVARRIRVAYVLTDPDIHQKVSTYIEKYAHRTWDRRIFEDESTARTWLETPTG